MLPAARPCIAANAVLAASQLASCAASCRRPSSLLAKLDGRRLYFVHSYRATPSPGCEPWVLATTEYGGPFTSAVQRGAVAATQFHPEKSGAAGLDVLRSFLEGYQDADFEAQVAQRSNGGSPAPRPLKLRTRALGLWESRDPCMCCCLLPAKRWPERGSIHI